MTGMISAGMPMPGLAARPVAGDAKCFPESFLFGTATAAYQVEGGWDEGGRSPSIWDDFCRARSDSVACANVADDFYHRYKSDVQLMADMGLQSFRFSISWSRVMNWDPATRRMKVNPEGVAFYHSLIDELKANNIEPILTLYHWDLPSELHTQLSPPGWLNMELVDHFVEYSTLMFEEFGRKVKYWATFNEPWSFTTQGYGSGRRAPGMSRSDTNVYLAAHHVLLAHAAAVARFRELRVVLVPAQESPSLRPDARISIVLNLDAAYPLDPSNPRDVAAAERKMQFGLGWYLQPIVSGEYPVVMRQRAGDRLPRFTPAQAALLKGSYDLFMLNHYSSKVATDCDDERSRVDCGALALGWERDLGIDDSRLPADSRPASLDEQGRPNCAWFSGYPEGYLATIKWMSAHDPRADILLTENGWCGNETVDSADQLWYFQAYLEQVHAALTQEEIPVIGYTAWSFVDNYEWGSYRPRFGLFYVDFTPATGRVDEQTPPIDALRRIPRPAVSWFAELARTKCLAPGGPSSASSSSSSSSAAAAAAAAPSVSRRSALTLAVAAGALAVVASAAAALIAAFRHRQRMRQRSSTPGERTALMQ